MFRRLTAFIVCVLCTAVLSAQKVDRTVACSIAEYFKTYTSDRTEIKYSALDRRRNNIVVNSKAKKVLIYCNEAFNGQAFTPEVLDKIYSDIRNLLPDNLKKYKIEILYKGKLIDDCLPNIYRKKGVDKNRLWRGVEHTSLPWVKNVSRPYDLKRGLDGVHLALWQSHGRYFSVEENCWKWQRPSLFCTTEDLFTQSIVIPFLMPMLENAGAVVYTPRERDWQPLSVVVDNDVCTGASRYVEYASKGCAWTVVDSCFAPFSGVLLDGDNPFVNGTSKVANAVVGKKRSESKVSWLPDIPAAGEYAIYVSYKTFENSVPDALYVVKHAGGETQYKVNQTMGGGTWVYLGKHRFEKGFDKNQGVQLFTNSEHGGVVSADAVRFGGGMGVVARGDSLPTISGMPRYLEAARYNLQTSGFPREVYSVYNGESDYRDDVNARPHAVNYLSGGSVYNPDTVGLGVPLELSFGFHSDAGFSASDSIVGSLGVVTTDNDKDTLATGCSRYMSRDLVSYMLNNVKEDLQHRYGHYWPVRGILDRKYGETRIPEIPSVIFESLSHQNFADLSYGCNPDFKFTLARSVYKSLLKHISYVHGRKYVVQPLPVRDFSMDLMADDENVALRWKPVGDPQEPTAMPDRYVVYTRIGNGAFDNGVVVDEPLFVMPIAKRVLYSFKVAALNDGGESLPSEVLSLYVSKKSKARVLVVNGFHRLSAPQQVVTPTKVGFEMEIDPGVPYMRTPEYCGPQLDFLRENIGYENGLGLSGNDYEGMLIAGNTFDYPFVHGEALAANGFTFVSCGSEAVMNGVVDISSYDAVDLILGVEKQGGQGSYLGYNRSYKTFPEELQAVLRKYCERGGRLFVSGAFLASDMAKNVNDRAFIREVLRLDYGGSVDDAFEDVVFGSGLKIPVWRKVNEQCYAVSRPDILVPIDDAFVSFVFDRSRESAGVAYSGNYRTLSVSFPFEAIADREKRVKLMGAVMRFLLD